MNNPRLTIPSPWMTAEQQHKPLKTTFEIDGYSDLSTMHTAITVKSEGCKDIMLHLERGGRIPVDNTKDDFISYFFNVPTPGEPSSQLAYIRKYNSTDISLMNKFTLFFAKNEFENVFEEHEHCNLTRGRTLTKQDYCFNRPIDRSMYETGEAGEYRTPEGYTGVPYHKRSDGTTNKYVSGSVTTLSSVYASYYENGDIGKISANLDDIHIDVHYNREGNIWAVDFGGNRVSLDIDKFMYNISTTMVKYYSDPIGNRFSYTNIARSVNSDVCTNGVIGFVKEDGFASCNPFASKDEEFIVNKIHERAMNEFIPEEIKNHVFNKRSLFSVRKISTLNNSCSYYQIGYYDDNEVKYNSFYNKYAMPIYIAYSYTQADGKHIEVKNCYDTFIPVYAKEVVYETMTETSPDKSNVKITNRIGNTTVTKEINYLDPDDRSKMSFKVNIETMINKYHDIAKFLGDVIEGEIDFNEYLDAVDAYIDTENESRITVPVPESIYTFFNSLIETTMDHSTMVIPVTSLPYGKLNFTYFRMNDIIDNLMDPCKIDSWVRQSGSYFYEDERLRRYLQLFNNIDFNSFILPKEEAKALIERVDKLFPEEDGEGDDF